MFNLNQLFLQVATSLYSDFLSHIKIFLIYSYILQSHIEKLHKDICSYSFKKNFISYKNIYNNMQFKFKYNNFDMMYIIGAYLL